MNNQGFVNLTDMPDDEAKSLVGRLVGIVDQGESDIDAERRRANDAISIWKNQFWNEDEIDYFQDTFGITPYQDNVARSPLSKLVNQQRASRYEFYVKPEDEHSFERHRRGREKYVAENSDMFDSIQQAREYYDRYYDDEYARAISIHYNKIRNRNKTKYVESDAFENMLITGCDFLKTTFTNQRNPDGEILTERKSVRQMVWDHTSVDPFLSDIEYIGEVHRLYMKDLLQMFPEHKEVIMDHFESYTSMKNGNDRSGIRQNWIDLYDSENHGMGVRTQVSELWYKEIEDRFQLVDRNTGVPRLIQYGKTEDEIWDLLYEIELDNVIEAVTKGEMSPEFLQRPEAEVKAELQQMTEQKYELRTTQAPVWNKCLFASDALLEIKRNPLPTDSHPYTPLFAQFTEGWYTGIIDDIRDLMLAYNKAIMFREVLLANSGKGILFVDKGTINKSGYTVAQVAEMWTEVGGVIDLELRGGRRLSDVFQQVSTMGQGLSEITSVINELEMKIFRRIGVNDAMLGVVGNEASASAIRQRIQQGVGVNGLIFDNFNKGLEVHAHEKVIPLVVYDLMSKQPKAIKDLSENREMWVELNYSEDFDLFVDAIKNGEYQTKLETKDPDTQTEMQQSAMLMELSMARPDVFSPEAALEFSPMPFRGEFLRRNRELMRRTQRDQQLRQIDIQRISQLMAEMGIDEDTAEQIVKKAQAEAAQSVEKQQQSAASPTIQGLSAESSRQSRIETENFNQNT